MSNQGDKKQFGDRIISNGKSFPKIIADMICNRCGYKGHYSKTCIVKEQNFRMGFPLQKSSGENSNVRKISGLDVNKVDSLKSNLDGSRVCFKCKETAHIAINCALH
ncbi:unnamed protein product [Gordionus sp. m RMFG-2023]